MMAPELGRVLRDPDLMLYGIDTSGHNLRFLEVTERSYRESGFLDQRIEHSGGRLVEFSLDQVAQAMAEAGPAPNLVSLIFHSSMCCSTLLTRLLDRPGRTMALREPLALYELSALRHRLLQAGAWQARRRRLLETNCALLSKGYMPGEHVIIKPSNMANALIDELAETPQAGPRGILLYSGLQDFLVSYLKKGAAVQEKLPRLAASAAAQVHYQQFFPHIVPGALRPARAAAVFWHAQLLQFVEVLVRHPGRFKTLTDRQFLAQPKAALAAVRDWLHLPLDDGHLEEATNSPHWRTHAKDPRFDFSPEMKQEEYQAAAMRHRHEIQDALDWLQPLLAARSVGALDVHAVHVREPPALRSAGA